MKPDRFNIRVYGLLVHQGKLLVSDEVVQGRHITKFPGGGLEFGEGPEDCLKREIREEMGVEATDLRHFYTTAFFQRSAFRERDQLISIYYRFRLERPEAFGTETVAEAAEEHERFRWIALRDLRENDVTFPVDRMVVGMVLRAGR